ncbi:hypothetical protein [Corallococcus exiguus]|nr:hypothetical protein [Corallococcus exiguus]
MTRPVPPGARHSHRGLIINQDEFGIVASATATVNVVSNPLRAR